MRKINKKMVKRAWFLRNLYNFALVSYEDVISEDENVVDGDACEAVFNRGRFTD